MASTRSQVSAFIARFSPEVASQFRRDRAEVRALFPRGYELVYDNYKTFGCGYSTTATLFLSCVQELLRNAARAD